MSSRAAPRPGRLALLAALLSCVATAPAAAFEFFEGRLQLHGFFESRFAAINDDFNDAWDLGQWASVLNLEAEVDIAPNGWGPFILLQAYARINVSYDCVWTRGCGVFSGAQVYGDRANKLPRTRLSRERRTGFSGGVIVDPSPDRILPDQRVGNIRDIDPFGPLFDTSPDAAAYVFERYRDFRFATHFPAQRIAGPWLPENFPIAVASIADRANPFNSNDFNPTPVRDDDGNIIGQVGFGDLDLPFRPAPARSITDPFDVTQAQGIYYPNSSLVGMVNDLSSSQLDQSFRESKLAWNLGASQEDLQVVREAYVDMEVLDGALWGRLGYQTIVWGKTELFRNQDRWNPTDLGAGPLAGLEESRVGIWAGRFVYSFYEQGPFRDVRLETVLLYDRFEPTDLGQCGESEIPTVVCAKRFGIWTHGPTALGVAGERRPDDPWDGSEAWEGGVRLEWRWKRFSFALTNYYGWRDSLLSTKIYSYSRNVDPLSGRPRVAESQNPCPTGAEPDCLQAVDPDVPTTQTDSGNALQFHHANQQLFAMICGGTIGLSDLDSSACFQSLFNSQEETGFGTVAVTIGSALSGKPVAGGVTLAGVANDLPNLLLYDELLVTLDGTTADPAFLGLTEGLSIQQQALLGCGPFYDTHCDEDGIDFLNAEASVLIQSWGGFDGNPLIGYRTDLEAATAGFFQPGTLDFRGGPVATRFDPTMTNDLITIIGARSQTDLLYNASIDGDPSSLFQPILELETGEQQQFTNELGAVSWNLQMLLVVSSPEDPDDPDDPAAWDGELLESQGGTPSTSTDASIPPSQGGAQCSFITPQYCSAVRGILGTAGLRNRSVRAGGNGRFARRDFLWHGGTPLVIEYEKKNVIGFSLDFAEDLTRTSWGFEATWENDITVPDNGEFDGQSEVDRYNLTVSVDRPTFINFLNRNRTFFFNSQWFVQYVDGYSKSFTSNGAWNALATFTVATAYFQDRLSSGLTAVYEMNSQSSALIHSIGYRFTENFRVVLGYRLFAGRRQHKDRALNPTSVSNTTDARADRASVNLGLSPVRDLDQFTLRIRYSF